MQLKSLTVFCGSKSGSNALFVQQAIALGELLAKKNIDLVNRAEGLQKTYEYFKALPPTEWTKLPKEFISK